jgi:cytochrome c2
MSTARWSAARVSRPRTSSASPPHTADAIETGAQGTIKGNGMPFGGLREARDIDDIVAYLKTLN